MKQKKPSRDKKSSRHHLFLISIFVIIILLAVTVYVLQRNTNITAVAGEAVRQRITETKQLALSKEAVKVATAVQQGHEKVFVECPLNLLPANEQHWKLDEGWKFHPLNSASAQCFNNRVSCIYITSETQIEKADKVVTYLDIPAVENCQYGLSEAYLIGCNCDVKK